MLLIGLEHLARLASGEALSAKMVFNAHGAIFLPVSRQHRETKAEGISYEDDYKGNAMAAMLGRGTIEIRFHKAYADADVARIIKTLLAAPELNCMSGWRVTYQGRELPAASAP